MGYTEKDRNKDKVSGETRREEASKRADVGGAPEQSDTPHSGPASGSSKPAGPGRSGQSGMKQGSEH